MFLLLFFCAELLSLPEVRQPAILLSSGAVKLGLSLSCKLRPVVVCGPRSPQCRVLAAVVIISSRHKAPCLMSIISATLTAQAGTPPPAFCFVLLEAAAASSQSPCSLGMWGLGASRGAHRSITTVHLDA
jgi:hypothetical protein